MGMRVNQSKNTEGEKKTYKESFNHMGFDCQSEYYSTIGGRERKSVHKKEEKKTYKGSFSQLRLCCRKDYSSTIGARVAKVLGFNENM